MRKNNKIMIMVFAIIIALMILVPNVQAKTINTLNATESNGKIKVSGTTQDGVLAVAIMIYDSTESTLVKMQTASVKNDNTYSEAIPITSGTYVVKVADYDGGEYITKTVTEKIAEQENEKQEENISDSNVIKDNNNTITETSNEVNKNENTVSENEVTTSTNPKTGDNIIVFVIIFAMALTGLAITFIMNKKRVKNSK